MTIKFDILERDKQPTITNGDQSAQPDGGIFMGPSDPPTSRLAAQVITYGRYHPKWPGAIILTPVTDPITVPTIPTGNQKWSVTAPLSVEGYMVVRKGTVFNAQQGLTVGSDNLWSVRAPAAGIHGLTDDLVGNDMADFPAQPDAAAVLEGKDFCHLELWCAGASSDASVKFRRKDSPTSGACRIAAKFPSPGQEEMWFVAGDEETFRISDAQNALMVGKQTADIGTNGVALRRDGEIRGTRSNGTVMTLNRKGSDGSFIDLLRDGSYKGGISVTGETVALIGAHLSRRTELDAEERLPIGTVLSSTGEMCADDAGQDSLHLTMTKVTDADCDPAVAGVVCSHKDGELRVAQTGDFYVRVRDGASIYNGALLVSDGENLGCARVLQRNTFMTAEISAAVIGKATTDKVTQQDGVSVVPCLLQVA